jgi:SAM-dependent methyltransferase
MFDEAMDQREVWENIALKWAEFRTRPVEEVEDFLKGKVGKVLDLGCGSGRNFIERDNLRFYGVDFSKRLLDIAKKKSYVELKEGTTDKIPYVDEFFDWVVFVRVLHCIEGENLRKKTFEEVYRVLRKNGAAIISTIGWKSPRVKNKPKEGILPWTVGKEKYERYNYIFDLKELEDLAKDVGFEIIKSWEDRNVNLIVKKSK